MYDPHSESSCVVPNMNKDRRTHAQVGNTVCGGWQVGSRDCETLINGQWIVSHQLLYQRYGHVMWNSPEGILLMGGTEWKSKTTELLQDDGTSVEMFQIEYRS